MIIELYVRMFYILVLCPVLLGSPVLTLTIDSQLGTSVEDCFQRVSIGEQLPRDAIYRNVSELTTKECEQICKQDKQCRAYDYGVGAKGNATCDLSNLEETEIKEKNLFQRNPDYDIYVRRFQCEQSPPTPIEQPFDSENGQHRPVFRPEDDEAKQPLSDDLNPYETSRPIPSYTNRPYRPSYNQINDRPDDYSTYRPNYDSPPSYGLHTPQSAPYPSRYNNSFKPDPYDILYFQDYYGRPRPTQWRPDPYHPPQPSYEIHDIYGPRPEKPEPPQYQYILRPHRIPYTKPEDQGYSKPEYTRPDPYGPSLHASRPVGPPRPYEPVRPYDKPSYSYTDQYASNYGSNQDNAIHVEIYDPPRPYRPNINDRPYYGTSSGTSGQSYGQGNYNYMSQNSYSQSQSQYGSNSWNYQDHRPAKPSYGSSNYGASDQNLDTGYGSKPAYKPKPSTQSSYGTQTSQSGYNQASHGDSYSSNHAITQNANTNQGYGSQTYENQANNAYGASQSSSQYGQQSQYESAQSYGNQISSQVSSNQYGSQNNNLYGQTGGYGNQVSSTYGGGSTNQNYASQNQHSNQNGYGNQVVTSANQQHGSYDQNSYFGSHLGYGTHHLYGIKPGSYGNPANQNYETPLITSNVPYGGNQDKYSVNKVRPNYGQEPPINNYGDQNPQSGYGAQQNYNKPSLNENRPSYGQDSSQQSSNAYGSQTTQQSGYGIQETYNKPSLNENRPAYGQENNRPTNQYGSQNHQSNYGSQESYNKNKLTKPSYGQESFSQTTTQPGYGNQPDGYNKPDVNGYDPDRPDVKPVYEHALDKPVDTPSYIVNPGGDIVTSRPMAVGDYGRHPGPEIPSYKTCFRRVLAGRRALRSHVRRVVDCERLEDCRRECATERRFHCESFNYRLDPTIRGKGLCELMTKPIEAFDIHQDFVDDKNYDFYEIDRNSLEPYCPETIPGPGLLHSGYLSSKPAKVPGQQNQWRDRTDWSANGYNSYKRFYDERRTDIYNRRHEDHFYVPYQIGVSRSDDGQENWGQYGGYYGGVDTYYKDRNDYHKSINHWGLSDHHVHHDVKQHHEKEHFDYHSLKKNGEWENHGYGYGSWKRGKWNNSGSFWKEYEADVSYHRKPSYFELESRGEETTKDCSSRRRPGMSLGSGAIRRSLLALTVVDCEAACFKEREFKCVSYSYRYSSPPGSDNCFLSERPYRGLEMAADSGSDVYAMPLHQDCLTISTRPWVESECFWHVRSGAAVSGKAVRAALTVTGLGACEAECIRAHSFFCRGFSFRFDAPTIGDENLENCLLTSSPPTSLEVSRGLRSSKHELYARGNYGRGCEPALYDDVNHEPQCYLQYDSSAKLIGGAVSGRARVHDERACGQTCTDAPFRCLSFSYTNNAPPDSDNCLLSEIRLFDLQRGVDYEHSVDDLLFAFDLFNGQCWRKVHGKEDYDVPTLELPHPLPVPAIEESYPGLPSGPELPPETFVSSSGPSGSGYPEPPIKPYVPETGPPSGPDYKPSGPDYRPNYKPTGPDYKPSGPDFRPPRPTGPDYKPNFEPPGLDYKPSGPEYRPNYKPPGPYKPDFHQIGPSLKPSYIPESGPETLPSAPTGPSFKPGYPSGPDFIDQGYKPRPNYNQYRPDYKPVDFKPYKPPGFNDNIRPVDTGYKPHLPSSPSGPGFKPSYGPSSGPYSDQGPGYKPSRPRPGDRVDESLAVSWSHYTVSGFPCRKGTTCEQNVIAGHWACEPEGGEVGSWDYCCAPTHRCGYSEGFRKPWCYVGPSHDQWRPCSEKYYPYHQHNVPHPSQGHREAIKPRPDKPIDKPSYPVERDRLHSGYLPESDRRYWDDLYRNGPQAYYDKYGNPLPGYTRVPTESRPHIKYERHPPRPASGQWVPVPLPHDEPPSGLGTPRYWPVAYLHKSPPPNMTYFRFNETSTTTERYTTKPPPRQSDVKNINPDKPVGNDLESRSFESSPRNEKRINVTNNDEDIFELTIDKTTSKPQINETIENATEKEFINNTDAKYKAENVKLDEDEVDDFIKGIDGKLTDFSNPIEVFDIEDIKSGKLSDLKTIEAEERQIEALGRLLASRRGGKLIIEKRSQKDLESKSIALDKDFIDFNFGNRFPTQERRGVVQKVSKDELDKINANDKSLEVSETTFVRPPRVLSTTENIRKAIINGKIFYDATIRDQRELFSNTTRRPKNLRLEENRGPSVINNSTNKKKNIRPRNTNPVRRVRRVYKKRYNPEEVRKRLLEREKTKNATEVIKS